MRFITCLMLCSIFSLQVYAENSSSSVANNTANNRMKECAANWQELKASGKTDGQDYKTYSAKCLKAEANPDNIDPQNKMKACAGKWNQMKETNTTNGQTYKDFSADCLKK